MEVKAQLNGLRIAPRKVRAITNLLKNKNVIHALNQMEFLMRRPVLPLIKLLNSAIANAENNLDMVKDNLYIKEFLVDEGVKLKRFRPKAQGRAGEIQKKTSRIRVVLDERVAGLKRRASEKSPHRRPAEEAGKNESAKTETKKHQIQTELGKKSNVGGIVKRLFRRKQI